MTPSIPQAAVGPQDLSRAEAVGDLYRRHAVGLVRLALLLVGDQPSAEDVVQEAFLGLYRNWPTLNDHGRVTGYLRTAVVNGCRDVLRARWAPGHAGRSRHGPHPAAGALAALPKYTVLINGSGLEVIVTATGRVAGRLSAPDGRAFAAIAGTAGDRTFFVAADLNPQTSCQAFFYRFRLGADGRPSALTPLPVGPLPGLPTALAASATGSLAAYSVVGCAGSTPGHIGLDQPIGHIGLIDLTAGRIARQWSYTLGEDYTNDLSMSADGRLLGYSNFQNDSQVGRVLAASAPPGPDQRYSAVVVRQPGATALSASGRLMYAMTGAHDQVLAAYDTASGQRVTVLHRWPAAIQPGPLVADPAGRYLLVSVTGTPGRRTFSPYVKGRRCLTVMVVDQGLKCMRVSVPPTLFVAVDLATGAATTLPFRESGPAGWGTVAW